MTGRFSWLGRMRVAACGLGMLFALPGAASASPAWVSTKALTGSGSSFASVAVDPVGDAVAVWVATDYSKYWVEAASRPAGGQWGSPVTISPPGPEQYHCEYCSLPQVAMDASGKAYVAWSWYDPVNGTRKILLKTRAANGVWGAVSSVLGTAPFAENARITANASGALAVVWTEYDAPRTVVKAWFRPTSGLFVPVQTISPLTTDSYHPQVAIDGAGKALAVWGETPDGTPANEVEQYSTRGTEGSCADAQNLSGAGVYESDLAMDAAGDAVVAWSHEDSMGNSGVEIVSRAAGATAWGSAHPLSTTRCCGAYTYEPAVAIATGGLATAVFDHYDGAHLVIQELTRTTAGGTWGAAHSLSLGGVNSNHPKVAIGANGETIAAWARGGSVVQAAARSPGGAWGSTTDAAPEAVESFDPVVAVDPSGDGVLAWRNYDGVLSGIRAAGFDSAGPVFNGLSVPATAVAGVPLTFSVSPLDVWSALGPGPIWSFGDGGTDAGTSVSHVYSAPGAYKVTLTQADAIGNVSSLSRQVTVSPSPCVVPKVVGATLKKAKAAITKAHCKTGKVKRAYSKRVKKGRVLRETPKARTRLANGAKVSLVVSRGRKPHRH